MLDDALLPSAPNRTIALKPQPNVLILECIRQSVRHVPTTVIVVSTGISSAVLLLVLQRDNALENPVVEIVLPKLLIVH